MFYSPSVIFYFGAWRKDDKRNPIPRCPTNSTSAIDNDRLEYCRCDLSNAGLGIDSCTGDKIYVAINSSSFTHSNNKLDCRVYQGGNHWTTNGRDSTQFEAVISARRLNECHDRDPESFPLLIRHTNDPTLVRVPLANQTTLHVMVFTGETPLTRDLGANYKHVATSSDGLNGGSYKALRAAPGLTLPAGLKDNDANGSVRAYCSPEENSST